MEQDPTPTLERVDDAFVLRELFLDAEAAQFESNRRAARQSEYLADVLEFARSHPDLYVNPDFDPRVAGGVPPLAGDAALAERCAALEASSRLRLTEGEVRSSAGLAQQSRDALPRVWRAALDGLITLAHVRAVVAQVQVFDDDSELLDAFDEHMREVALSATVAGTRRQARTLADRLTARTRTARHAEAFARRTMYVEDVADGMSWMYAMVTTERAHAIDRELTRTAKRMTVQEREGRAVDQIRADLFAELLSGGEVATAKVKVLVTVPLDRLTPHARATVRRAGADHVAVAGLDLNSECLIPGVGPIDDATGRQLLLDAGAFTRVVTDPVSGVILDMDRRSRKATRAQREWLALVHGTCARDGCERLALDADIDHHCAYHGPGRGETDIGNLDPLCDPDHALKDTTLLRHHRRDDGTVEVRFPSGHQTRHPFQGLTGRVRALLDNPPRIGDAAPF